MKLRAERRRSAQGVLVLSRNGMMLRLGKEVVQRLDPGNYWGKGRGNADVVDVGDMRNSIGLNGMHFRVEGGLDLAAELPLKRIEVRAGEIS